MSRTHGFGRTVLVNQVAVLALSLAFLSLSGAGAIAQQAAGTDSSATIVTPPVESATVPGNEDALSRRCVQETSAYRAMADSWAEDPNAFLGRYFGRGSSVAVPVRNVLIVAPREIDRMVAIMADKATDPKLAAQIALGIGQATLRCSRAEPLVTLAFQERMAQFADTALMTTFMAALGDVGTAALGGGAVGTATTGSGTSSQGGGAGEALSPSTTIGSFGSGGQSSGVPQSGTNPTFRSVSVRSLTFLSSSSAIVSRTTP